MNDLIENTAHHFESPDQCALKTELEKILKNLEDGIIPSRNEIADLKNIFNNYFKAEAASNRDGREMLNEHDVEKEKKKGKNQTVVQFKNVLAEGTDTILEDNVVEEVRNVRFLKRLVLQKLILCNTALEQESFISYLNQNEYITVVSVNLMGRTKKYYMLTSKGWKMVTDQENMKSLQRVDPSFLIPNKIIMNTEEMPNEMLIQAAILHKYYEDKGIAEYIILPCEGEEKFLYGCEMRDTFSIHYSSTACFVPENEKREAAILYKTANSDKIDDLTVVVRSEAEETQLKIRRGLDPQSLKRLRFYTLSEENKDEFD